MFLFNEHKIRGKELNPFHLAVNPTLKGNGIKYKIVFKSMCYIRRQMPCAVKGIGGDNPYR